MTIKNPDKFEYAELLYMKKVPQKTICEKVRVTAATLCKWKEYGEWEAKRAARAVSIDQLIAKALIKVDEILNNDNFSADEFAKAVAPLKKLQGRITPDDKVAVLMDYGDWFISQVGTVPELTGDIAKLCTMLQDLYIVKVIRQNG